MQQLVLHRQYAPYHHGAFGVYVGISGKHFRKPFIHPSGYVPVLSRAERGQFAESSSCLITQGGNPSHHVAASVSQGSRAVCFGQRTVWRVIFVFSDEKSRTVSAVMTYIERLFAVRRSCHCSRLGIWIGKVVACREMQVFAYFLAYRLRSDACRREYQYRRDDGFSHRFVCFMVMICLYCGHKKIYRHCKYRK